ncbi:hypothetical protein BKA62DRAFT_593550, partial [Auriculariales sp. MPI-PUGE-AT-0066]
LCGEAMHDAIQMSGGEQNWQAMGRQEQEHHEGIAKERMAQRLGKATFVDLPVDHQAVIRLWLWFGCFMHKQMNFLLAVSAAMPSSWAELQECTGFEGPKLLPNKDNAAGLATEDPELQHHAEVLRKSG